MKNIVKYLKFIFLHILNIKRKIKNYGNVFVTSWELEHIIKI